MRKHVRQTKEGAYPGNTEVNVMKYEDAGNFKT